MPIGKLDYQNILKNNLNENINLFCNDLNGQSTFEKEKKSQGSYITSLVTLLALN